ncbi:TPA: hypothetical protein ACHVKA_003286 [Yersinia enterocolitica]
MSERFKNKNGENILIKSFPEDGMNTELPSVGKIFGVIKTMVALKTELIGQRMVDDMKKMIVLIFQFIFLLGCTPAVVTYPADIMAFIKIADECQYLAGEWDPLISKERQVTIEKEVNITCPKATKLQKKLSIKYQKNKQLLDVINNYDF